VSEEEDDHDEEEGEEEEEEEEGNKTPDDEYKSSPATEVAKGSSWAEPSSEPKLWFR